MKWLERLFRLYFAALTVRQRVHATELHALKAYVQGVQVSAPFGRVPFALEVFEGLK